MIEATAGERWASSIMPWYPMISCAWWHRSFEDQNGITQACPRTPGRKPSWAHVIRDPRTDFESHLSRFFVVRNAVMASRISCAASFPLGMAAWNSVSMRRMSSARLFLATPPFSLRSARALFASVISSVLHFQDPGTRAAVVVYVGGIGAGGHEVVDQAGPVDRAPALAVGG